MEITKYKVNEAEIAKMSSIYMDLTIDGIDDEAGASEVHAAKMIVVKHRTSIDKLRLSTNKNAQDFIKTNNKNAADLIDLLAPIEKHLKAEENTIAIEKERIQAEKEAAEKALVQKRVFALLEVDLVMSFFDIAMLTVDEYTILLDNATKEHQARQDRLIDERKNREAEVERLEKAQKDQVAEAKRLADIRDAQDKKEAELKEQQEAIAKEQAEKEAAIEAERKAIEDEKLAIREAKAQAEREERERIDREDFEKQAKKEAEVQAKKDADEAEKARKAQEKADREAKEQETKEARFESLNEIGFKYPFNDLGIMPDKQYTDMYKLHLASWNEKQQAILAKKVEKKRIKKEAAEVAEKARKAALAPDKEKLIDLATAVMQIISPPAIKNEAVKEIVKGVLGELSAISDNIISQAEEL